MSTHFLYIYFLCLFLSVVVYTVLCELIYRVGQKTDCFWVLVSLQWLIGKGVWCVRSSRILFVEKKYKTCMIVHLNSFCPICINIHYTWNLAKFAKRYGFYPIFNSRLCSEEPKWSEPISVITYAAGTRITARHSLFVKRWLPVSAELSTGTWLMLHCYLPVLPFARVHWTGKLVFNSLDLNPVDYPVWRALQQMVHRHRISDIDRLTCTRANWLLVSAKRGHIEPSDQSAGKRTEDGHQGKGCSCWIWSGPVCIQMIVVVTFAVS